MPFEAVNVDVQHRNPHSLLWWMKRLIALYKRRQALGLGTLEFLHPENRKVFACVRRYHDESILVVANLSRFVQPAELDLAAFQSLVPVELFGRTEFPSLSDKPYFLTLGPHALYWFSLESQAPARVELAGSPRGTDALPALSIAHDWQEVFHERNRDVLERALRSWLPLRRWFGGVARAIKGIQVQEIIPVPTETDQACLTFLLVEYVQTEPETYVLPSVAGHPGTDRGSDVAMGQPGTNLMGRVQQERPRQPANPTMR